MLLARIRQIVLDTRYFHLAFVCPLAINFYSSLSNPYLRSMTLYETAMYLGFKIAVLTNRSFLREMEVYSSDAMLARKNPRVHT